MTQTRQQFIQTAQDIRENLEEFETHQARKDLLVSAAETLATGNHRPLTGTLADVYGPATPLRVMVGGVLDGASGQDNSASVVRTQASGAAVVVGTAVVSASVSGAGALAGYAGLASAVSAVGGGAVTTAIASAAGITAASGAPLVGAAATTALVSVVGGPVVAAGLVVASVASVGLGVYSVSRWLGRKLFG